MICRDGRNVVRAEAVHCENGRGPWQLAPPLWFGMDPHARTIDHADGGGAERATYIQASTLVGMFARFPSAVLSW